MTSFFLPAIRLSNLYSFKAKFVIVTLLCAAPLLFFFYSLSSIQREQIEARELQLQASQYINPLRRLVEHIAQTRGMTNAYLNGNESFKLKIMAKRKAVENDFTRLKQVNRENAKKLQLDNTAETLYTGWTVITIDAFSSDAAVIFKRYTQLISRVIDFMDTVGRKGKMLQDPDAGNSYIINSLLHTLPNQMEALGKLRGKGAGIIASGDFSARNKIQISLLADNRNAKSLEKDVLYLFDEVPDIKSLLGPDYSRANNKLMSYLLVADKEIITNNERTIDSATFFSEGSNTINSLLTLFDALQPALKKRMETQITDARRKENFYLVSIVIILALLIYLYVGIYLGIKDNLTKMMKTANAICDGDLNARLSLNTRDELKHIGTAVNDISDGISRSMVAVKASSKSIAESASEIAESSRETSVGMNQQAAELDQVSTAITEMSASVAEVAKYASQGSQAAQQANDESGKGKDVVEKTVESIHTLADNIQQAAEGVTILEENSNNITQILDVIRGIAEQTNLLALNAAIEAARAGEQGRGFAVVADEVRTLAQRTQDSTHEIQKMIELIQSGISGVSSSMEKSQSCAEIAVENSNSAGDALIAISGSVSEIANMSIQIATAAEEQSSVSEEVAKSIVTIADVSSKTSSGAQVLVEAGSKMAAMSEEMKLLVGRYSIDEQGFINKEKSKNFLQWSHSYDLGIPESDRQHRKMVDLMNEVHVFSQGNRSNDAIASALDALIEFTAVHFKWEETFFDQHKYPESERHKSEHKKLINELRSHQKTIQFGNSSDIDKTLSLLNDWLLKHIEFSDKDYANFIAAKLK